MESKKINQLATEMSPATSDLAIIGDPITGVSKKITWLQVSTLIGSAANLQQVTDNGATTTNPITIGGLTISGLSTGVLKSDSGVISSVPFGTANGVATLGGDGKVPSSQLPSYVDDVVEVANYAALPVTGETGKIYITLDNNKVYRWSGSVYVEIAANQAVWGSITGTLANQTDLQNALNAKANDSAVVHLAGTETITGTKTFSNPSKNDGGILLKNGASYSLSGYMNLGGMTDGLRFTSGGGISNYFTLPSSIGYTYTFPEISGTIVAISGGNSTQYIDGTGALQTFPTLLSSDNLVKLVRNQSGATMAAGTIVYISGATGNKPLITKALATGDATSAQTFGLVQSSIANNADGYVVIIGNIGDLDTSALTEGQQLYLSGTTAGAYTTTKPYAPIHLVYVGIVLRSHPTQGIIGVKIQNGYEMDELHNVDAQSPSNNDILSYNTTTSLWEHKQIATTLGYTPANAATYVPYTGATTNVNLGSRQLTANNIVITSNTSTYLSIWSTAASGNQWALDSSDNGNFYIAISGGSNAISISPSNKVDFGGTIGNGTYTYTLPSATGTLALTSDLSAYLPLAGGTMTGNIMLRENVPSGTIYYIGQLMGNTDTWKIYGSSIADNQGELVFELGDDAQPIASGGQRFNFFFNATTQGTSKSVLLIDYNEATFNANLTATSFVKSGGTSSQFLKANGSVDSNTYLTTGSASSTYLPLAGGTLTGALIGTTANFSGKVGINATIAAWVSGFSVIQMGALASFWNSDVNYSGIGNNIYYNGTFYKYLTTSFANKFEIGNGTFTWEGAPSGTAGDNVTFTEYMRLDTNGNLGLRTTTIGSRLQINGNAAIGYSASTAAPTNGLAVNGSVGIGTNTPSGSLEIAKAGGLFLRLNNTSSSADAYIQYDVVGSSFSIGVNGDGWFSYTGGTKKYDWWIANVVRMSLSTSGNLLLGSNPTDNGSKLQVSGAATFSSTITSSSLTTAANGGSSVNITTNGQSGSSGSPLPTEITFKGYNGNNNGRILVNDVSNSAQVGNMAFYTYNSGAVSCMTLTQQGNAYFNSLGTGLVYSNGGVLTSTNPSDERLKENINDISFGLNEILQLRPVSYDWKNNPINQSTQYGFIAQEVQKILPQLVNEFDSYEGEFQEITTKRLGLDKDAIFVSLVKAIQEQQTQIEELKLLINK